MSLFEEFSRNSSEATGLIWYQTDEPQNRRIYSFSQLNHASAIIAQKIKSRDKVIPLFLPHSPLIYVAVLAILRTGNAFCPIPVDAPPERIKFIIDQVRADEVLCGETTRTSFGNSILLTDDLFTSIRNPPTCQFETVTPGQWAYVMFTSGSTGLPKAVPITHQSVRECLVAHDWVYNAYGLEERSHFLQFANLTFDVSVFEIFSSWRHGLVLVSADRSTLLEKLPNLIQDCEIEGLELTPSIADYISISDNRPSLSSVKLIISIGEAMTARMVQFWDTRLLNAYGPVLKFFHQSTDE